jgi:mono/diheme cytochrome c family protein
MALAARERELNGQTGKGCNDMRTTWCAIFAASAMMATIDVLNAQPEENPGRNEFLQSCASCHGVSGKGDGPVAKSLSPRPSDLTKLSEANNGVFPVSRVHEVIDGRIERLVHGTRDMPVWGERYMREMISPEFPNFASKEWAEAMVDGVSRLWSNIFQHCSDQRAGAAESRHGATISPDVFLGAPMPCQVLAIVRQFIFEGQ